jgi:hypothetical protein
MDQAGELQAECGGNGGSSSDNSLGKRCKWIKSPEG